MSTQTHVHPVTHMSRTKTHYFKTQKRPKIQIEVIRDNFSTFDGTDLVPDMFWYVKWCAAHVWRVFSVLALANLLVQEYCLLSILVFLEAFGHFGNF